MNRPKKVRISNNKKRKVNELIHQANAAFAGLNFDACEMLCKQVDVMLPDLSNIANLRGSMAASQGHYNAALSFFGKALKSAPENLDFLNNIARLYAMIGRPKESQKYYKDAIKAQKTSSLRLKARMEYCKAILDHFQQPKTAVEMLIEILNSHPNNTEAQLLLSSAYSSLQRYSDAANTLNVVIDKHPNSTRAHYQMGMILSQVGDFELAVESFRTALSHAPDHVASYSAIAIIKKFKSNDDSDIHSMQQLKDKVSNVSLESEVLSFAIGKAWDDVGDVDKAFVFINEGNRIRSQRTPYFLDPELDNLQHTIDLFPESLCKQDYGIKGDMPIFIVGMPRSGSTLIEQILAAHQLVLARGESGAMGSIALARQHSDEKPFTIERMANFSESQWEQVGADYLEAVKPEPPCERITDKALNNIRLIGAIHAALPQAKIIHIRRHPLDTCWSIYKHNLEGEMFGYGAKLEELGRYYKMYQRLMLHWNDVLPEGVMLEINYEELVSEQEKSTQKMLEFCGLEWDENCLQFHKLRNQVNTASVAQVRRPIYKDSVMAWQRYEQHLQPLIKILGTDGWSNTL